MISLTAVLKILNFGCQFISDVIYGHKPQDHSSADERKKARHFLWFLKGKNAFAKNRGTV